MQLFIVPALREGRIVITNIEGIKSIEAIQQCLGETFPASAQLWRMTALHEEGKYLWQRWFHWAPLKALIVIDEVQDIYPADRRIKLEDYDNHGIDALASRLPAHYVSTYHQLRDNYQAPPDNVTDDLGHTTYDDDGKIIYPTTLLGAMTRHRKFTWDICFATPDITLVNMAIRGSCEYAYKHNSMDLVGRVIPFFTARPRIKQHRPKSNGEALSKGQHMEFKKVDKRYFQLYQSTQTGEHVQSGRGKSLLDSTGFKLMALVIPAFMAYGVYSLVPSDLAQDTQASTVSSVRTTPDTAHLVDSVADHTTQNSTVRTGARIQRFIPGQPSAITLTATVRVTGDTGDFSHWDMLFRLQRGDKVWHMNNNDLAQFGIKARYVSACMVTLTQGEIQHVVTCTQNKNLFLTEISQM